MFQYKEVKNPIFKYSVLAVIALTIFGIVWLFNAFSDALNIGRGSNHYYVKNSTLSPAKNYVATSYVEMGGGAAGWCSKLVQINNANEPIVVDKEIFRTRCSNELEVQWLDENNLNIANFDESTFESKGSWSNVIISYSLIKTNK
jgi:hypothetical protein